MAKAQGKFDEANRLLDRALGQTPSDLAARLVQAQLRLAQKKPAEAVGILKRVVESRPRSGEAYYQLGLAHVAGQELNEAVAALTRAEELSPNDLRAPLVRAEVQINRGELGPATTTLQEIVRRAPGLMQAQLLLGRAYVTDGKYDQAQALFQGLNEKSPKNPVILFRLGLVEARRGRLAEARKAFEEVQAIAPEDLASLEQLVELDLATKNSKGAEQRLKPALEKNPKAFRLWQLQARVAASELRWEDAEKALEKALEIDPGAQSAYVMLAEVNLKRGDPARGLQRLSELVAKEPENQGARVLMGMIQEQIGRFAEARTTYEAVLQKQPESMVVLNNLAYLLSERLQLPEEAFPHASKAARLAPEDPFVADTLGWIEYRRGNYPEAVRLITKSKEKLSNQPEVAAHLGLAAYMSGDEGLARRSLTEALKDPADYPARKLAEESLAILNLGEGGAEPTAAVLAALEKRRQENPKDVIALLRLGLAHEAAGRLDAAREALQAAYKLSPASAEVLRRLAALEVDRDPALATDLARKAQQLLPDDPLVNRTLGRLALASGDAVAAQGLLTRAARQMTNHAGVWVEAARAYLGTGKLAESEDAAQRAAAAGQPAAAVAAAKVWSRMLMAAKDPSPGVAAEIEGVLKAEPDHLAALRALALLREKEGKDAEARDLHERLLQRAPGFSPSMRQLVLLYAERLQQDDKAWALATKARTAYPSDAALARCLGGLAFRREDYRYALQVYGDLARMAPKDGSVQFQIGLCHVRLRQNGEARAALNKALALEPNGPFAAEARKVLAELDKG